LIYYKKSLFVLTEPGREKAVSREVLWWDGIELAPPRPRQGFLAKIWETHQKKEQYLSGEYLTHLWASVLYVFTLG
jgi:hypothetical protein